jgi:hypothetical protein
MYRPYQNGIAVSDAIRIDAAYFQLIPIFKQRGLTEEDRVHPSYLRFRGEADSNPTIQSKLEWVEHCTLMEFAWLSLSDAVTDGRIPVWIVTIQGSEARLDSSMFAAGSWKSEESIKSGSLIPNGLSEFQGANLWLKTGDIEQVWLTPIVFNPSPASNDQVIQWCRDWIANGKGNGMDNAWKSFKAIPAHCGLSRDDSFRPAWRIAKTS